MTILPLPLKNKNKTKQTKKTSNNLRPNLNYTDVYGIEPAGTMVHSWL